MAYDAKDPRARLATAQGATPVEFGGAEYVKFYETQPQIHSEVESTWLARGQDFVIAYSTVAAGAILSRSGHPDEYVVMLPDQDCEVEISTPTESTKVAGRRLVVVPPGDSTVTAVGAGRLVRIFSAAATDLTEAAANAASYDSRKPNVAPFRYWPEPPDGYQLRVYDLDVTQQPGRFGRIWRCTNLMINYTEPRPGPRDVTKMSPHVHADFEQASLVLDGSFVHHIRWPWGTDMRGWRPDEHEICAGPSLTVIPPGSVHTSQQVSQGLNQLVDIFGPPRWDFSHMDGWVLNADEYPMPAEDEQ